MKKPMLYHPALNIPERGMTGRYRPAGVDKEGIPMIDIEMRTPDVVIYPNIKSDSTKSTNKRKVGKI